VHIFPPTLGKELAAGLVTIAQFFPFRSTQSL
jgi:hypothetical protein